MCLGNYIAYDVMSLPWHVFVCSPDTDRHEMLSRIRAKAPRSQAWLPLVPILDLCYQADDFIVT